MAFPARKPEAGKAKNSRPCSTSDGNRTRNNFVTIFLPIYYLQLEMYQYQKLFR